MVPASVGVVIVLGQAVLESARVLLALGFHQKVYLMLFLTFLLLIHPCDRPVNTVALSGERNVLTFSVQFVSHSTLLSHTVHTVSYSTGLLPSYE
jgi:hypothetical protein